MKIFTTENAFRIIFLVLKLSICSSTYSQPDSSWLSTTDSIQKDIERFILFNYDDLSCDSAVIFIISLEGFDSLEMKGFLRLDSLANANLNVVVLNGFEPVESWKGLNLCGALRVLEIRKNITRGIESITLYGSEYVYPSSLFFSFALDEWVKTYKLVKE